MRRFAFVAVTLLASTASAQPVDPYGPQPPGPTVPPPPITPPSGPASPVGSTPVAPSDPVLAEQIAESVVGRAQELYDAKIYLDAKQLAVEAIVTSPKGPSADHARMIVKLVNQQLGIREDFGDPQAPNPDPTPITDPTEKPITPVPPPVESGPNPELAGQVHGALFGAVLGAALGTIFTGDEEKQAGGAVALGIGGGLAGAWVGPRLADKLGWNEAQVRTAGAGSVWGGVIGAFIGDIGTGLEGTSARQILVSAGIGSLAGGVAGGLLANQDKYTRGDIAMIDTFAGMGAVGGLTLGMVMQPAESEAYSLNAVLGTAGGILVGLVAAPQTNTTPRRMARVAGAAAIGVAAPLLLYLAIQDDSGTDDERAIGLFSTGGLFFGAYMGFRYTKNMDVDKDVKDTKSPSISFGNFAPRPLSRALDNKQRGATFTLLDGTF